MAFSKSEQSESPAQRIEGFEYAGKFPETVNIDGNVYTWGNELPEGMAAYSRVVKGDFPAQRELLVIDTAGTVISRLLQDDETRVNKQIKG